MTTKHCFKINWNIVAVLCLLLWMGWVTKFIIKDVYEGYNKIDLKIDIVREHVHWNERNINDLWDRIDK